MTGRSRVARPPLLGNTRLIVVEGNDECVLLTRIGVGTSTCVRDIEGGEMRTRLAAVLPDGASAGALETLQRQAVEPARAACVDALFACTGATPGVTRAQQDKAWVHAFAATVDPRARGDRLYGQPPKIDPTHPVFDPLRTWLAQL